MSNPKGTFFDGSYDVLVPTGPIISWRDPVKRSMLYRQRYHQRAEKFRAAVIGQAGPNGAKLAEETQPGDSGIAGIVEWERIWAVKPSRRVEMEPYVHAYQFISGSELIEVALPVSSRVVYDYFETADGSGIPIIEGPRVIRVGTGFLAYAGEPDLTQESVAENSAIARWLGNFWERRTRYVPSFETAAIP